MNLNDVPIKRKLTTVIVLTSMAVVLLTSLAFIIYELKTFRSTTLHNSQTLAQITAANSTAAVSFEDERNAAEILSKLHADETVLRACLYNAANRILAYYPTNQTRKMFPASPGSDGYVYGDGTLKFFVPVLEGENRMGTLFMEIDLEPMYERLRLYGLIVGLILIGSFFAALTLSNWLQSRVSEPILELAETARLISGNRDYLVRAKKYGNDELGALTDAFNHMLQQIHEREAALRESEERLRLALDASQTGTWNWDVSTGHLAWDYYSYRLFGLEPGQFDSKYESFLNCIHPDDRGNVARQIERVLQQGGELISEFRVVWPDNSVHYLASRGKALYNERNKPVRMSGVVLDITESREAAEALSLLAAIVESTDDAIIGKDLDGKVVSWNDGAERMFEFSTEEVIGKKLTELIIPSDRIREEIQMLRRIRTGHVEHFNTVRRKRTGETLHVSMTVSPIRNSDGRIIGASSICRDISDRIRAEEEIRALNAELEERVLNRTAELAATNTELESFTYSVSHDLRAPLRHIDAYAQILDEELKSAPETTRKYIQRIRAGVQNMGKLVDDLLNLSRAGRQEIVQQDCDLNAIIEAVIAESRSETENREIEWRIGKLPHVRCDSGLIKQVFANLISNSIKYTRPRPKAVIEIGVTQAGEEIAVFVRDNGVGFDMKYAHKLFGVFQRLHRAEDFEGTGVGLATVQRIIQLHHGRIWADAKLDKGATFYFTLRGMK